MPELRKDPVLGRWVIVATDRGRRPQDFTNEQAIRRAGPCPFCSGNEHMTPPEIIAYRPPDTKPNGPGWRLRVVANKYPVLGIEGTLDKKGVGMYDRMWGIGAHEVVIETPEHKRSLTELDEQQVRDIMFSYRDRLVDLRNDRRLIFGMVFKNVGAAAGASLEHTHSQIICTPVVPRTVEQEMAGAQKFHDYRGRCIFCDMIEQEQASGSRVVAEHGNFIAFEPYASRFPYETWILPRRHSSHFEDITATDASELAHILRDILGAIEKGLSNPAYNYIIHSTPMASARAEHYHWHMEIIPRLTSIAGFEWGTGFYINPVSPEAAADFLRSVER
jgi:UDPglucose--hexose-1-phosphate uridylyltransferase